MARRCARQRTLSAPSKSPARRQPSYVFWEVAIDRRESTKRRKPHVAARRVKRCSESSHASLTHCHTLASAIGCRRQFERSSSKYQDRFLLASVHGSAA